MCTVLSYVDVRLIDLNAIDIYNIYDDWGCSSNPCWIYCILQPCANWRASGRAIIATCFMCKLYNYIEYYK